MSHQDLVLLASLGAGIVACALAAVVLIVVLVMHDRRRTEAFMLGTQERMLIRHYNEIVASRMLAGGGGIPTGPVVPEGERLDEKALNDALKRRDAEQKTLLEEADRTIAATKGKE